MWQRLLRALNRNIDVIAFGASLITVGPLMAWWSVLVRRNIITMDYLWRAQLDHLPEGPDKLAQLAAVKQQTDLHLLMIGGESATAACLLFVLAVALFMVARHRRSEARRMQTMLQLTTHQLKTPIAGMRTLLQSLENGSIPVAMQREFLNRGVVECDRLEHLVETILAYQRAVVREPQMQPRATDALVAQILDHRQALYANETVAWKTRSPSTIRCDPDAFQVVFENLLDNARKYGGDQVELIESAQGEVWRLKVADHGQGFDPTKAERLFEPFERGGGAGVAHGSGLGLFIARQLMRRMGGELHATSPGEGQGATFIMEMPVSTASATSSAEVAHG
jgi:signal transduction histidine kinase